MKFGLVGFPVGHSYSRGLFRKIFENEGAGVFSYQVLEVEYPDQIISVAEKEGLEGFNVTIPHKESIIPYLDRLDSKAKKINAVNVVNRENQKWVGYNTDHLGFSQSLDKINFDRKSALILGNGGSSRAIDYALRTSHWEIQVVSRRPEKEGWTFKDLEKRDMTPFSLVVNCTPLGMSPNDDSMPDIPFELFSPETLFYDLVYKPEMTRFLMEGEKNGGRIKNGLEMLILQAQESWRIWKQ